MAVSAGETADDSKNNSSGPKPASGGGWETMRELMSQHKSGAGQGGSENSRSKGPSMIPVDNPGRQPHYSRH